MRRRCRDCSRDDRGSLGCRWRWLNWLIHVSQLSGYRIAGAPALTVVAFAIGKPAGFLDAMLQYELRMGLRPFIRQATVSIRTHKAGPSFEHGRRGDGRGVAVQREQGLLLRLVSPLHIPSATQSCLPLRATARCRGHSCLAGLWLRRLLLI